MPAVSWYVLGILIEQLNLTFLCSESTMCPIVWLNATGGRSFDAAEVAWGAAVCAGCDLPVWDGDSWSLLEWGAENGLWSAGRLPGKGPENSWSGLVSSPLSAVPAKQNIKVLAFKMMKKTSSYSGQSQWSRASSVASEEINRKLMDRHILVIQAIVRLRQEGQELKTNLSYTVNVCLERIESWDVAQW